MSKDKYIVTCPCGEKLLTLSFIKPENTILGECARVFLCPQKLKEKYGCSAECEFKSRINKVDIHCVYCDKKIQIFLPCSKIFIVPGYDLTMYHQSKTTTGNLSIETTEFGKESYKIFFKEKE